MSFNKSRRISNSSSDMESDRSESRSRSRSMSESDSAAAYSASTVSPSEIKHIENMDKLMQANPQYVYESDCLRKKANWSKSSNDYKFDHPDFDPKKLMRDIPSHSSKLSVLLKKIKDLDKKDMEKDGRLYKHFIFSDVKSASYGAKLIAGALIASGMQLGYNAPLKQQPIARESQQGGKEPAKKTYGKITFLPDNVLRSTNGNTFFLLSSLGVYDQPITVALKKSIFKKFNERPDNVHGDLARIIIMDAGYKEGVDLFDIKYVHIFEPPVTMADQRQVIGRGTRTCGQKGLEFHPTQGWPLHVFIYDVEIPESMRFQTMGTESLFDLYLKSMNIDLRMFNFQHDLERATIYGSVDYELNRAIHTFSIESQMHGGGPKVAKQRHRIVIREDLPVLNLPEQIGELVFPPRDANAQPMGHDAMRAYIRRHFSKFKWTDVKMENNCAPKSGGEAGGASEIMNYTPTQDFIRHFFTPENPLKGMLLFHSTGSGKCHAKDTPILLHDGRIKMVQDIEIGDVLMGDDSTPRKVLSLANGEDDMYKIIPVKGDSYVVNSEHILCLKTTGRGNITYMKNQPSLPYRASYLNNKTVKVIAKSFATKEEALAFLPDQKVEENKIIEIEVNKYLKLAPSLKRELKGYRKGVDFPYQHVDMDPYIIGLWLGDGGSRDPVITNQDATILKYLKIKLNEYDLQFVYQSGYTYRISSYSGKPNANAFWNAMKKYNLQENKHIPYEYKCNSREMRMSLLAGIIDSDGYYCKKGKLFSISQKSNVLTEDILYLVRSLGFAAYSSKVNKSCMYKGEKKTGVYNSITISGNGLDEIPTLVKRKQAEKRQQIKDALSTGITVEHVGRGNYYGFTLDGNNRYLMGDFTVTHNTCSAIAAASSAFEETGYTILWVTRTTLKTDIWKNMFDQICSENIKSRLESGDIAQIPDENTKRMRLLSKSWSIRPMSYKQFSNLVLKVNNFYKALVKKNGEIDPLRKTLLIIDEAHKLYGGGDLSSIERPDMNALQNAIQQSYEISGHNSVRLLLMTATPITQNPMELIQLINLTKPLQYQMPQGFDEFSRVYLDEYGRFTPEGEQLYLDNIAGHVSYLNRERDARQFAQPIVKYVKTPLIENIDDAMKFDRSYARAVMDSEIGDLKKRIDDENAKIDDEFREIKASNFDFMKDKCDNFEGKALRQCNKIVRTNIRAIVNDAKAAVKDVKDAIQELKEQISDKKELKREFMENIKTNMETAQNDYADFKDTIYYAIKKCGKKINNMQDLREALKGHPAVVEFDRQLAGLDDTIAQSKQNLQTTLIAYKSRMEGLKKMMREDLTDLEKNVIRSVMKDERKTAKRRTTELEKSHAEGVIAINKTSKALEKKKQKKIMKIRQTMREYMNEEKKVAKEVAKEEKALRKTQRKQGVIIEKFKNEFINGLVDKYTKAIDSELTGLEEAIENQDREKAEAKEAVKKEKAEAKEAVKKEKAEAKEVERRRRELEKQAEKERKQAEREKERETRRNEKAEKQREKQLAKKNATRKNTSK